MLAVNNLGTQLLAQVPNYLKRFVVELQKALLAITDHHTAASLFYRAVIFYMAVLSSHVGARYHGARARRRY
jgi:hypothetical protein